VNAGATLPATPEVEESTAEQVGELVEGVPVLPSLPLPTSAPSPEVVVQAGAALPVEPGDALAPAIELLAEPGLGLPNADAHAETGLRALEFTTTRPAAGREGLESKAQAPAPERPSLPLPREERAADILQQLRINLNASTRSAVIQLSPPELGLVTIQIKMEEDKLRTLVRAERPETLDALARHLPELRNTLQQQGLQTNDIQLELGLGNRDRAREEAFAQASRRRPRGESLTGITAGEEALLTRILAPQTDGVDLYA
jgi:hypothetical protein